MYTDLFITLFSHSINNVTIIAEKAHNVRKWPDYVLLSFGMFRKLIVKL